MLVLNYMHQTGQGSPEAQMQAETYVGTGYQRLLTFEVEGGGFSLFGQPPAQVFLTAYGLMEFSDMAKVYPVDEKVIERAAQWLLKRQQPNGTWQVSDYRAGQGSLGATAYVTWALIEAGYADTPEVERAISYLREFALQEQDTYSLALAANALAAYDPEHGTTGAVTDRLFEKRTEQDGLVYWTTDGATFMGARGQGGSVETTALAAYALMKANVYPDAVSGALAYLIQSKDSWGTWNTTQGTILSLKALLLSTEKSGRARWPVRVQVSLNGEQTHEIAIDKGNADVMHLVTFDHGFSSDGANRVQIQVPGGSNLMYQVTTSYYLPWNEVPPEPVEKELITVELSYDRTALAVNDEVTVNVDVRLNQAGTIKMALVDLGVPPGFTVLAEDLNRLVEEGLIARYELTGRQIIIYLEDFSSEKPLSLSYRLRARFPMRAMTPPSGAYDYYNPMQMTERAPLEMVVNR